MTNKNPTAWEYDHESEWTGYIGPIRRYRIVEVIRENPQRSCFYDDPEHDKVKP